MMKKRNISQIVFTNDEDLKEKMQTRGSRVKRQSVARIKTYDFNYSFKEYLKLALSKVLPRQDIGITFIPQKRIIVGLQTVCTSLINKTIDEFQHKKFTVLTFKTEHDIDQIQYWLQDGAHIYRQGVIEVALRQIQKMKCFISQCQQFRNKMVQKRLVLLRVDKNKESRALQTIHKVLNQSSTQQNQSTQENTSRSYNDDISSSNSHIDPDVSAAPITLISDQNESHFSYIISENDETMLRDSFCMYSNKQLCKFNDSLLK